MNCESAREQLLTADPAELESRTGSPLSDHLRTCTACRAAAERLLTAQRALHDALGATHSSAAVPDAAQVAIWAAERHRAFVRRVQLGVKLAAAAMLAGVLVMRRIPEPPLAPPARVAGAIPARFAVSAPPGRNVLVLQQPDTSHVIVVWFF
jgi:predicted anti-sigma-YlaC factor YlaD